MTVCNQMLKAVLYFRTMTPQPIERANSAMSGGGGLTLSVPTQRARSVLSSERF